MSKEQRIKSSESNAAAELKTSEVIIRFIRSMRKQRARLIIVLLSVAAYTVFNIMAPAYSATVVDLVWDSIKACRAAETPFSLGWANGGEQILILLVLYAAASFFYVLQNFLMASFAETLSCQIRSEMVDKLHRLPLSYYDAKQAGEVMSQITNDLDKVSEALQTGLIRLFVAIGTIIGALIMMFKYSVLMTVVFLAFMAISLILTAWVSSKTLSLATARQEAVGELNGLVEEAYSGRMVIKAFQYEEQSSSDVHAAAEKLARAAEKTDFVIFAVNPGIRLVNRFGIVAVAIIGGWMVLGGRMTPGIFQAFYQYLNQAGEPITELAYMINSLQSAFASMKRVYGLMDEAEMAPDSLPSSASVAGSVNADGNTEASNSATAGSAETLTSAVTEAGRAASSLESDSLAAEATGKIEFEHVRFGYTPEKTLMQDVSFEARPGQMVAIVGETGAGKTTLVNLLMRFYDVNGGRILLDDKDIMEMSRAGLRSRFGMVLQDTWLFEGTIAENIAYGRPDASREEIIAAAKAARADFFIRTLPKGYDTVLTNDAENISIGQRQLLTIARVFLCDPSILILDEATSSVDTRTEMEIGKAMHALMEGRTSFVIAHRLSTIVNADMILVMENGTIIEKGTHEELLAAGGAYASLYNSQFA
jgi:ATP-binding cassette, subfamily B, multidrug efflux pump